MRPNRYCRRSPCGRIAKGLDEPMKKNIELTGLKTKRKAGEQDLKSLAQLKQQEKIRKYRGKLQWEGDLEQMRRD